MKTESPPLHLKAFAVELAAYTILVVAYVILVLHALSGWLKDLFVSDRLLYAGVALLLMIVQGVGLEMVTTGLLNFMRSKTE